MLPRLKTSIRPTRSNNNSNVVIRLGQIIRALVYSRTIADTIPARRSPVLSFLAAPKPLHHAHFEYNTALRPWGGANFYTGQSYSLGNAARHPLETVLQGGDTYNSGA